MPPVVTRSQSRMAARVRARVSAKAKGRGNAKAKGKIRFRVKSKVEDEDNGLLEITKFDGYYDRVSKIITFPAESDINHGHSYVFKLIGNITCVDGPIDHDIYNMSFGKAVCICKYAGDNEYHVTELVPLEKIRVGVETEDPDSAFDSDDHDDVGIYGGYDTEKNDYSLEQLSRDITEHENSAEFRELMQTLKRKVRERFPHKIKGEDKD